MNMVEIPKRVWVIITEREGEHHLLLDQQNLQVMAFTKKVQALLTCIPTETDAMWALWKGFLNPRLVEVDAQEIFKAIDKTRIKQFKMGEFQTECISFMEDFNTQKLYDTGEDMPLIVDDMQRKIWQAQL